MSHEEALRRKMLLKQRRTFVLTEDHIKLVRRMYVEWDSSCYDGAPAINIKRPYGNSHVVGDVAEIIEMETAAPDDISEQEAELALQLHRETKQALQIILRTGEFRPGYYQSDNYGFDWELVPKLTALVRDGKIVK